MTNNRTNFTFGSLVLLSMIFALCVVISIVQPVLIRSCLITALLISLLVLYIQIKFILSQKKTSSSLKPNEDDYSLEDQIQQIVLDAMVAQSLKNGRIKSHKYLSTVFDLYYPRAVKDTEYLIKLIFLDDQGSVSTKMYKGHLMHRRWVIQAVDGSMLKDILWRDVIDTKPCKRSALLPSLS